MEASWAPLGASWGVFGASWGHLGASWGVLAASWRVLEIKSRLGSVLEASWALKSLQDKPVLIGTGSAFVCCKRPVPSCRVWCLVLLRKKAKLETLPKQPKHKPKSSKIFLNTSQNPSQNLQKSSPRPSKIEVWRRFRWKSLFDPKSSPLFSAPGGVLGRPGSVLGASWSRLGAAMGRLGASWERLGGVLGRLGSVLGRLAYTP